MPTATARSTISKHAKLQRLCDRCPSRSQMLGRHVRQHQSAVCQTHKAESGDVMVLGSAEITKEAIVKAYCARLSCVTLTSSSFLSVSTANVAQVTSDTLVRSPKNQTLSNLLRGFSSSPCRKVPIRSLNGRQPTVLYAFARVQLQSDSNRLKSFCIWTYCWVGTAGLEQTVKRFGASKCKEQQDWR